MSTVGESGGVESVVYSTPPSGALADARRLAVLERENRELRAKVDGLVHSSNMLDRSLRLERVATTTALGRQAHARRRVLELEAELERARNGTELAETTKALRSAERKIERQAAHIKDQEAANARRKAALRERDASRAGLAEVREQLREAEFRRDENGAHCLAQQKQIEDGEAQIRAIHRLCDRVLGPRPSYHLPSPAIGDERHSKYAVVNRVGRLVEQVESQERQLADVRDVDRRTLLSRCAAQIGSWHEGKFPTSTELGRVAKLAEEAGEVCGAVIKESEGRALDEGLYEELGDVLIVASTIAHYRGWALSAVLADRFMSVRER